MENTTAVDVREEAEAFPLPVPPTRFVLVARFALALVVRLVAVIGVFLLALQWASRDEITLALVRVLFTLCLLVVLLAQLGRVEDFLRATTRQLQILEGLAQHDRAVRLYLRRVYGLGRPILGADLYTVVERDNRIKNAAEAAAEAQARAEREQAVQARIQALVAAPDQPAPPTSAPEQSA